MVNDNELEGSGRGLIEAYPGTFLEELRKTTKILKQDNRCIGRDWNQAPPEHNSRALPVDHQLTRYFSCLQRGFEIHHHHRHHHHHHHHHLKAFFLAEFSFSFRSNIPQSCNFNQIFILTVYSLQYLESRLKCCYSEREKLHIICSCKERNKI
jgi:hypothetical protein